MTTVVFRADASVTMGTGHVMRCLTLASALRTQGAAASFVCRNDAGNLCDMIGSRGFAVTRLPGETSSQADAELTREAIEALAARPDWLVVDNYGFDRQWESVLRPSVARIMVIDDMADRPHDCDLLLDQNHNNPRHKLYSQLLPAGAKQLLGASFAMVRPEFAESREKALRRRAGQFNRLLVSFGGTDPENETAKVLAALKMLNRSELMVDVVIGESNPHRPEICELCDDLPASLHIQTSRMADLMAEADLAVNGGGSTTWERCVLGLPAIVTIQSENQAAIAEAVGKMGAHQVLGWSRDLVSEDYRAAIDGLSPDALLRMSEISAGLCDGNGASRVAAQLMNWAG